MKEDEKEPEGATSPGSALTTRTPRQVTSALRAVLAPVAEAISSPRHGKQLTRDRVQETGTGLETGTLNPGEGWGHRPAPNWGSSPRGVWWRWQLGLVGAVKACWCPQGCDRWQCVTIQSES